MENVELFARVYCVWLVLCIIFCYYESRKEKSFVDKWLYPLYSGVILSIGTVLILLGAGALIFTLFAVTSVAIFGV